MYFHQASILDAEKQIRAFEASSYPNMKDNDRRQMSRYYQSIVNPIRLITQPKEVDKAWQLLKDRKK